MLMERTQSALVLIDVQEKLTPFVAHPETLIHNCRWLLRLAKDLFIPCLVSEQYPQGLGTTLPTLKAEIDENPIEKVCFSSWRALDFAKEIQHLGKKQVILIGIETHVCVLQTAIDLFEAGFKVFVVVDAVSSRFNIDYQYALKRMEHIGITLVTCEMVFFEWIGQAGNEEFKTMSKKYMRSEPLQHN